MVKMPPLMSKKDKAIWQLLDERSQRAYRKYFFVMITGFALFIGGVVILLFFSDFSITLGVFLCLVGFLMALNSVWAYAQMLSRILLGGHWLPKAKE